MRSAGEAREPRLDVASAAVPIDGRVRPGSRVRLDPRRRNLAGRALGGRIGRVEGVDRGGEGRVLLAVVLEDDPGRDSGAERRPGNRFFFDLDEVEPVEDEASERLLLVAGVGNVFLGDDGFGPEVVRALAGRETPASVDVVDFGVRGMDLVHALGDGYDGVILIDAGAGGDEPGTLELRVPEVSERAPVELLSHAHDIDPALVLAFARRLAPIPESRLVIGCKVASVPETHDWAHAIMGLSAPVRAAVEPAVHLVLRLAEAFVRRGRFDLDDRIDGRA